MRSAAAIRLLALHQALWRYDRFYRYAWIAGPQALSFLVLLFLFLLTDLIQPGAAPWAKPVATAAGPDFQLCSNYEAAEKPRGEACERLLKLGTLTGKELSIAYTGRAWMRYKENQSELSIADYREAIKHYPDNANAHYMLGAFMADKNDLATALVEFNEAIRAHPSWASPHAGKAEALRRQGRLTEALAEVNTALSFDPNLKFAQQTRSQIEAASKEGSAASNKISDYSLCINNDAALKQRGEACDRLIKLGTLSGAELSNAYFGRGWMRGNLGQTELSLADQSLAIQHNPNNAAAHNVRGALLLGKNEIASALGEFDEAIRIAPGWATPQANKAESLRRQGHLSEALLAVNAALSLDPGLEYAQKVRDAIQADKRKKELAAAAGPDYETCFNTDADYKLRGKACDRLIKLGFLTGPELSSAYVGRGWMRYKDGQSGLSIADHEEALKHNPSNALAYGELGAFMLDKNDPAKALPYFDEAIRTAPKWAYAYAGKAEALRRQGKLSDALAEVDTALSLDQNLDFGKRVRNSILASAKGSQSSRRK